MKSIFFNERPAKFASVWGGGLDAKASALYGAPARVFTREDLGGEDFSGVEYIFSTWGMPVLTEEEIAAYFPALRAVFYAAGTVQAFARPFLARGVRVFSAWRANALPVIEYSVSQILLANKGFFALSRRTQADRKAARKLFAAYPGNFGAKVGILGDGAIGSGVIAELLRHRLEILVFSITMSAERSAGLGVRLASLEEIFAECDVISNHLANNAQTVGMLNRALLSSMKPYATFINTGRGAQVDEDALCDKLEADPTVTAVLDVTFPEPPEAGSRLLTLPNVILTPHIAGSSGDEVRRMAEYMLEEAALFEAGKPTRYEVTPAMLDTMA